MGVFTKLCIRSTKNFENPSESTHFNTVSISRKFSQFLCKNISGNKIFLLCHFNQTNSEKAFVETLSLVDKLLQNCGYVVYQVLKCLSQNCWFCRFFYRIKKCAQISPCLLMMSFADFPYRYFHFVLFTTTLFTSLTIQKYNKNFSILLCPMKSALIRYLKG